MVEELYTAAALGTESAFKDVPSEILVNIDEKTGMSILHVAALFGRHQLLKKFLDLGVDVNFKSYCGWTPLHLVINNRIRRPMVNKCVQFLISMGADINAVNDDLNTPLHMGASEGLVEALRILIKNHADIFMRNKWNKQAIDVARLSGHLECSKVLAAAEWGVDQDFFAAEARKMMRIKEYRDDILQELSIIDAFQNDIDRTENFKNWLASKNIDGGPPVFRIKPPSVIEKEVKKTHREVFGKKYNHPICEQCGTKIEYNSTDLKLPNLSSSYISNSLFGQKDRFRPLKWKNDSVFDVSKRRSTQKPITEINLKDPSFSDKGKAHNHREASFMERAATIPINLHGKSASLKDYVMEKSIIC